MPQSEKLKLKAEMVTGDREVEDPQLADQKTLARQIYEAYLKNFNMNKAKARTILTGKTSTPVRWLRVVGWWVKGACVDGSCHYQSFLTDQSQVVLQSFIYFLISFWAPSNFAIKLMSQYDRAASTSEIMCNQPMTEITCSIGSASQHTSWTRQHLFAPKWYKGPSVWAYHFSLYRLLPSTPVLFSSPIPSLVKNIPSQPCFFHFLLMRKKKKVHKGRVSCDCSPKLLRIPWIGVCRCRRETGQTKCKAMFKHRPPPLLLEIKASRWISVHFRVPTEGVSGVCSHWKAVGWKCTYCLIYHSPVYICWHVA